MAALHPDTVPVSLIGGLIALLLGVLLLVWYLMGGTAGSNRFGAGPKMRGVATAYGRDRGPADHPPPYGQQPPASLIPMVAGSGPLRA